MEEPYVYTVSLDISLAEFDELIQDYFRNEIDRIKVKEGFMIIQYAKLFPPTMIGTDNENNRVIRIQEFSGNIEAIIIE